MFSSIDIVKQEMQVFLDDIARDLDSKNITNTGAAKQSLRIEVNENTVNALAVGYLEFLNFGRGGGKYPPVDKLKDWVRQKLGISDEKENSSIAYLVGRKIANEGTSIYKNKSKGIEFEDKLNSLITRLQQKLPDGAKADVQSMINQSIKDKFK